MISPLPDRNFGDFLNQVRSSAQSLWQGAKRTYKNAFQQPETITPLGDPDPSPYTDAQGNQRTDFPGGKIRIIYDKGPSPTPTPVSSPSPTPSPSPVQNTNPSIPPNPYLSIIQKYFPADQVDNASGVQFKESSYIPNRINVNDLKQRILINSPEQLKSILDKYPNTDVGLWQINYKNQVKNLDKAGFTIYDMLDPEKSTQFASWLYSINGYEPWYGADALGLTSRSKVGGE